MCGKEGKIYFMARNYDFIKKHKHDFFLGCYKNKYNMPMQFETKKDFFKFIKEYLKKAGNVQINDINEVQRFLYNHEIIFDGDIPTLINECLEAV